MKTLLLTLVVVTIVCLDLGYTRTCWTTPHVTSETCPDGETICYKRTWCDAWCGSRGKRIELGCAATCPTHSNPRVEIECCSTDDCNTHP